MANSLVGTCRIPTPPPPHGGGGGGRGWMVLISTSGSSHLVSGGEGEGVFQLSCYFIPFIIAALYSKLFSPFAWLFSTVLSRLFTLLTCLSNR
jgi:hypothetical protein